MSIIMQGGWTVTIKSKSAAFDQRVVISRPRHTDFILNGVAGNSTFVNAAHWSLNVQSRAGAGAPWIDSRQRIGTPAVSGGVLRFDIRTDDTGGDLDYNDLIVTCSMPVASSEFVVYGKAKTYQGRCIFNPCYPWYLSVDTVASLRAALEQPDLRKIIEKLYPERIPRWPVPPDPGPQFMPMLLPKMGPQVSQGLVFRSAGSSRSIAPEGEIQSEKDVRKFHEAALAKLRGRAVPASFDGAPVSAGAGLLTQQDLFSVAKLSDRIKRLRYCDVEPAPGILLRFQEYDRTDLEKAGGSYTGTGTRENLGLTVTDELGNYIFRFSRTLADLADETLDAAPGEDLATQIFPDVIVQTVGAGLDVQTETPPYWNIPNLVRIDLCLPYGTVHPSDPNCTGLDRIITRIGDVVVQHAAISGSPNTLTPEGKISCHLPGATQIDCAAWRTMYASPGHRAGLALYACMTTPAVARYTVRYSTDGGSSWDFVHEPHQLFHAAGSFAFEPLGPISHSVQVDGGGAVPVPTYENHGGENNWIENDLKIILDTNLYRSADNPGTVKFKIQGYDAAGNMVAGVEDTIPLFIANRPSTGKIHAVDLGTPADDDCTNLTLPAGDPNAPVFVKYTVDNPDGFLESWGLSVIRGNNCSMSVTASGVVPASYPVFGLPACTLHGTPDFTVDSDGHTVTQLVPNVDPTCSPTGNWLPAGKTFCAFAFILTATDRVTDGRFAFPQTVYWPDMVGLNL